MTDADSTICTQHEVTEVAGAKAAGKQPVLFVHRLWLAGRSATRRSRSCSDSSGDITLVTTGMLGRTRTPPMVAAADTRLM
jgi:hypothetical protein